MGFMLKAIAGFAMPAITTTILNALSGVGISGTMTVSTLITSLLTGAAVFLTKNAPKKA